MDLDIVFISYDVPCTVMIDDEYIGSFFMKNILIPSLPKFHVHDRYYPI
jgi:hypothetical protein